MLRTILLASASVIPFIAAADSGDLARCAAIADAAARLSCFDGLTRADPVAVDTAPVAEDAITSAPSAPPATAVKASPITPTADPSVEFGAENLPQRRTEAQTTDRIESRLRGTFEGWQADTEFELENGQVWRCTGCRPVYHRADNPKVTVRRGFTGVYWLRVEGLNQQAKVRRIK